MSDDRWVPWPLHQTIDEDQIGIIDFKQVRQVLIARPGESSGVEVWVSRRLPPFSSAHTPGVTDDRVQIVVSVEDPDDPETIKRIEAACAKRAAH